MEVCRNFKEEGGTIIATLKTPKRRLEAPKTLN
jgi:hypothetical protein